MTKNALKEDNPWLVALSLHFKTDILILYGIDWSTWLQFIYRDAWVHVSALFLSGGTDKAKAGNSCAC